MLIKKILVAMFTVMVLTMISGCDASEEIDANVDAVVTTQATEEASSTTQSEVQTDVATSEEQTTELDIVATEQKSEEETPSTQSSVSKNDATSEENTADLYVGTYNDYDNNEPSLEISLNEDGTYSVAITIFRLTSLEDGVGIVTDKGLEFMATDATGNPIEGVITLAGNESIVTFTNSTWELIENGTSYRYVKVN